MRFLFLVVVASVAIAFPSRCVVAADALYSLNVMRASVGLYPLQRDQRLQAGAEAICQTRASRRHTNHLPGNGFTRYGARYEGVGHRSIRDPQGRRFLACYSATRRHRYAGVSAVTGPNGTYYTILLR